jgi:hypothetical protein
MRSRALVFLPLVVVATACGSSDSGNGGGTAGSTNSSTGTSASAGTGGSATSGSDAGPQPTRLRIVNGCSSPLWIFFLVGSGGGPLNAKHQQRLAAQGDAIDYPIPDEGLAATRFWPGVGCDSTGNNCTIGQSGGPPADGFTCPDDIGCAPAIDSKFEGTFGCLPSVPTANCQTNPSAPGQPLSTTDNWDTSMVDGYTLPYTVKVTGDCPNGPPGGMLDCSGLTFGACPTSDDLSTDGTYPSLSSVSLLLQNPDGSGNAGCYSPCAKLTDAQWASGGTIYTPSDPHASMYCCPTPPVSSSACRAGPGAATAYVKTIHDKCPNTYAYAYDDGVGLWTCPAGAKYEVTFYCPQ